MQLAVGAGACQFGSHHRGDQMTYINWASIKRHPFRFVSFTSLSPLSKRLTLKNGSSIKDFKRCSNLYTSTKTRMSAFTSQSQQGQNLLLLRFKNARFIRLPTLCVDNNFKIPFFSWWIMEFPYKHTHQTTTTIELPALVKRKSRRTSYLWTCIYQNFVTKNCRYLDRAAHLGWSTKIRYRRTDRNGQITKLLQDKWNWLKLDRLFAHINKLQNEFSAV